MHPSPLLHAHPQPPRLALCRLLRGLALAAALGQALPATAQAGAPGRCQTQSPAQQVLLLELYTSEGCNSCPPADRWLSTLRGRPDVLAAAFHVDYWDRLGWTDRFGHATHSARQAEQVRRVAAGFAYTPQVLANGRDWRGWPTLPVLAGPARVHIALQRLDAQRVQATLTPAAGAPPRLALWWALLEDGHRSAVGAGENRGALLQHDHVVRHYQAHPAWTAQAGQPMQLLLPAASTGEGGRAARLLLVVTEGSGGPPLQAAMLGC